MTLSVLDFGSSKEGAPHSESFASSRNPQLTSILTSFLTIDLCALSTGYDSKYTVFLLYFNYKSTRAVFHILNVLSSIY